jgi:hypothetical protein
LGIEPRLASAGRARQEPCALAIGELVEAPSLLLRERDV